MAEDEGETVGNVGFVNRDNLNFNILDKVDYIQEAINNGTDLPSIEGDILIDPAEGAGLVQGLGGVALFGTTKNQNRQWPKGVVHYVIDSSLSHDSRAMNAIRAGMNEITSKTCIRYALHIRRIQFNFFTSV